MSFKPAYTVENYTTLQKAIVTGVKSVSYGDKRVEYRSLEEMLALLRRMEKALCGRPSRRRFAHFDRGYNPNR